MISVNELPSEMIRFGVELNWMTVADLPKDVERIVEEHGHLSMPFLADLIPHRHGNLWLPLRRAVVFILKE